MSSRSREAIVMTAAGRPGPQGLDVASGKELSSPPEARLVWASDDDGRPPSGAWWPRTRDAAAELTALVPLVSERLGGPVNRVSLNMDAWSGEQPRRLRVGGRIVRVGWFHTLGRDTVTLGRGAEARAALVVVPPELDADAAQELLWATEGGSPR
jgi:hypothetical protein